jgi:hypothetical protein
MMTWRDKHKSQKREKKRDVSDALEVRTSQIMRWGNIIYNHRQLHVLATFCFFFKAPCCPCDTKIIKKILY